MQNIFESEMIINLNTINYINGRCFNAHNKYNFGGQIVLRKNISLHYGISRNYYIIIHELFVRT